MESLKGESHARVRALFESFRDGSFTDENRPPKLTWEDAESLMIMGKSTRKLTSFPVNPLSSFAIGEACEGVVALWLLEQIRTENEFYHSLNPLCLSKDGEREGDFAARSFTNQPRLVEAYQAWWAKASEVDEEDAKAIEPLADSDLYWY
jgi:hypothetical protein